MSQLQLNMEEKVIQTKFSCRAYTSKYCIIRVINKILRSRGGIPICQPRAWLRTELDVLLRINYNRYDFRTQQIHLSQIPPLEKKKSPFQKFLRFFRISGYFAVDYFVPKKKTVWPVARATILYPLCLSRLIRNKQKHLAKKRCNS